LSGGIATHIKAYPLKNDENKLLWIFWECAGIFFINLSKILKKKLSELSKNLKLYIFKRFIEIFI
jgi:hypothetical protein